MDPDTWACPICHSSLGEFDEGLRCSGGSHFFRRRDSLPLLLRAEETGLLREAENYAKAWKQEAGAPPPGAILQLPYVRGSLWKQKARALDALVEILGASEGRALADIGAGTGWLSYRLTQVGFRCFATDISADSDVGLGAAGAYDKTPHRFERAVATLTQWPFRTAAIDVAITNASLHYSRDIRPVIEEARRVLRPGGAFVVLNSPVHRDSRSAERAAADFRNRLERRGGTGALVESLHHLVSTDLEATLGSSFSSVRRHDPDYGVRFRATRAAKGWLLGIEFASFPIYEARRP